uniref:Uncharacterized protein n=1 Tax=Salix viminalis TaxID=40686 RepID=A0A6N2LX48_SALVM
MAAILANPWWTGQVGLPGLDPSSNSPSLSKINRELSINETSNRSGGRGEDDEDEDDDRDTGDEPKEGAVEAGNEDLGAGLLDQKTSPNRQFS